MLKIRPQDDDSSDEHDVEKIKRREQMNRRRSNEILPHAGRRRDIILEPSFNARASFIHFAQHAFESAMPGSDFIQGRRSRSSIRQQPGWYDRGAVVRLRKIFRCWFFSAASMLLTFAVLFLGDAWVLCQVPTNLELDVIFTCALLFFLAELVGLCVSEASYPMSLFFLLDLAGLASLVFNISYLCGPDATLPARYIERTTDGSWSAIVSRAARSVRLGARLCRLSRVAKILHLLDMGLEEGEDAEVEPSTLISNRLSDTISVRVACLTISIAMVLPSVRLFEHPETDESMLAWTQMVATDVQAWQQAQQGAAAAAAATKRSLDKELARFVAFYGSSSYGPFLACLGGLADLQLHTRIPPSSCDVLELNTEFAMPQRKSSILEMRADELQIFYDVSSPQRWEAALTMGMLAFVIVVILVVHFTLSSQITVIALSPLERMLSAVRERCGQIFKYASIAESAAPAGVGESPEEWRAPGLKLHDGGGASEFLLLENAVAKLAAIVHLSVAEPESDTTAGMSENDLLVISWMQGRQMQHERISGTSGGSSNGDSNKGAGNNRAWKGTPSPLDVKADGQTSAVKAKVPQELALELETETFDSLVVPEKLKQFVVAYILLHKDGSAAYTRSIVSEYALMTFVSSAQKNYFLNPFHNFSHALDVTYSLSSYFRQVEVDRFLSHYVQFWLLIAAIGHDLGHWGVNNQFLIDSSHELAVMYNDRSPLENMHCSKLFKIISDPNANVFGCVTKEEYAEMRKGIIAGILHTDLTKHNEMVKELNLLYQMHSEAFDSDNGDYACEVLRNHTQLICNSLLHCADIGNPTKPWKLCNKIANLIIDEFFAQGDKEKELGIPVGLLNDRDKVNRPNSQIGFIEFMISPYVEALVPVFPHLHPLTRHLADNLRHWVKTWIDEATPPEDTVEKVRARMTKTVNRLEALAHRGSISEGM